MRSKAEHPTHTRPPRATHPRRRALDPFFVEESTVTRLELTAARDADTYWQHVPSHAA